MALQEDDVIIPNLIAPCDHDEKSDEDSNNDNDDVPLSPKQHRKIDPGFLPNDVVLVIEDEHLHVNRALLESASPVFAALLKKEWQKEECSIDTKQELKFPGKTYDDMVTFLKCLLPNFPDKVTDETLDTVLPLADEYRTEKLITECVEVIRQRVESVSEADVYIPPSRIVTYLLWIEKYNFQTLKELVVKLASCLNNKVLEAEPGYKNISLTHQMEISTTRANLLSSLFVRNVTEAKGKLL
ncbi:BTB and MATH domain-containing protein 38-like [Mizuhopecten yessoensis]|uniref:BTB and MATH domain-containing protein 38-like n=1 Tax=Mizuhopecten yessoensis TaxID=6573 RepID=UPI000B45BC25|nr:BTB and MATH domain-containing protein 38-like [Mizuhopecten yessoensis]